MYICKCMIFSDKMKIGYIDLSLNVVKCGVYIRRIFKIILFVFVFLDIVYIMFVKFGDVFSLDINLYVQLFGEKGEISKIMLRFIGSFFNKFEKGRIYKFIVEIVNIGKVDDLVNY